MRTNKILGYLSISGADATFALLNLSNSPASTFLAQNIISDAERELTNFVSEYSRTYGIKEEYNYILGVFIEYYNAILSHASEKGYTYTLGITSFADLSDYEYKMLLGYKNKTTTGRVNSFVIL